MRTTFWVLLASIENHLEWIRFQVDGKLNSHDPLSVVLAIIASAALAFCVIQDIKEL